jgi:putative MFS transporter
VSAPTSAEAQLARTLHADLAAALDRIGFGRAQKAVLALVAIGTIFDAIEQFNVSYAAPALREVWHLSSTQIGLLSTATFGGVAIGCLIAGIVGDLAGRKTTYLYNLGLYTVGSLIGALAPNLWVLVIGRIVVGIGLGGELNTGITLVSELVPTRVRGACTAVVNVAGGGLGIFFSTALAWVVLGPLGALLGGPQTSWRFLLGVLVLPSVLVFVYRRYVPESPRFLLSRGRVEEANQVLTMLESGRLRGDGRPVTEYLRAPEGVSMPRERVRLTEVFSRALRRRTTVLWVISFMAFGAQDTITIFMPTILVKQGYGIASSLAFTLIINVGGLVGAVLASVAGHYWVRRIALGYGALAAIVTAVGFVMAPGLGLILLFGALFQMMSMLLNTLIWVYAPELYPTRIRAFGVGASVFVASAAGSIIPPFAGRILDAWGAAGIFGLAVLMYLVVVVAIRFGPETVGRSLEQLSELDETPAVTEPSRP